MKAIKAMNANRVRNMLRHAQLTRPMASDMAAVRRRAAVIGVVIAASLLGMAARAGDIAIERHEEFAERGNRQQVRSYTLEASRGNVLDRNYVSLAVNDYEQKLVINPRLIHAREKVDEVRTFLHSVFPAERHAYIDAELDPPVSESSDQSSDAGSDGDAQRSRKA